LEEALIRDLGPPEPWSAAEIEHAVRSWACGPRPLDVVIPQVRLWMSGRWQELAPKERGALWSRLDGAPWVVLARDGGFPSVPACMRAVRRAVAGLIVPGDPPKSTRSCRPRR
jgi:hypothetical protein